MDPLLYDGKFGGGGHTRAPYLRTWCDDRFLDDWSSSARLGGPGFLLLGLSLQIQGKTKGQQLKGKIVS